MQEVFLPLLQKQAFTGNNRSWFDSGANSRAYYPSLRCRESLLHNGPQTTGFPTSFPEGFYFLWDKDPGKMRLPQRETVTFCFWSHWAGSRPSPAPPLVFLNSAQWGLWSKAEQNVCLELSGTLNRYTNPYLALKISLFSLISSHPPLWSHLYSLCSSKGEIAYSLCVSEELVLL